MALIEVGNTYINPEHLYGVSDVIETPPPSEGLSATFSFQMYLEGSSAAFATQNQSQAQSLQADVLAALQKQSGDVFSSGGQNLIYTEVNVIGGIGSDPAGIDPHAAAFSVQMDGVSCIFRYPTFDAAEKGRADLVASINGA